MDQETVTPGHPRWQEFVTRLEGPEGCDFKKDANGKTTLKCGGGCDKAFALKILTAMGFDGGTITRSLSFFDRQGGHCDCEIVFNVNH